jgi:hypothetical protein
MVGKGSNKDGLKKIKTGTIQVVTLSIRPSYFHLLFRVKPAIKKDDAFLIACAQKEYYFSARKTPIIL